MYTSYQKYKRIIVFIVAIWSCLLFSTVAFAQVDQTKFETSRIMNVRTITSTKSELEVGWDHLEGASVYEVWKLNPVTNGYDMIDETTTESYKISGLSQGVKISILIRAYYEYNGKKIYSAYSDMLPTGTVPNDVGNIQVVSTDSALIALTWEPSSSSSSYIIYRANEGSEEFVQIANVNATSYSDMKVSPASGYTYKIVAYITDTNIQSENATSIRTATTPIGTVITQSKGGSERARLRWSKIFAGDGYIIYSKDELGNYIEVTRVRDLNQVSYILKDLVPGNKYVFCIRTYKEFDGTMYYGSDSNEVSVIPHSTITTSTKPSVYKTLKKLKKSKLYKKYTNFSKSMETKKNIVIPGIKQTNIDGFVSKNMVTQATAIVEKYMLISAYDYGYEENSVVYVLDKKTGSYLTTIALPDAYHVGGMAYDGVNVWISTGQAVSCFTYQDVKKAVNSGLDSYLIQYKTTCEVKTQASFVTYYNKMLWVGEHKETAQSKMYGYSISKKKSSKPKLKSVYNMTIPSRTQDVMFMKDGTMIVSCSNQISASKSKYYISQLRKYTPKWGKKKKGRIKLQSCKGKITMPPMMEGIAYEDGYLYIGFESASIKSCPYKMDRICALRFDKIEWKN